MEENSISYFKELWKKSVEDLKNLCCKWEKISKSNILPEDVLGEIRTATGLANLLMNQKLKQFRDLISDSENETGEKEITCSDLQGFWDMVYFEVEKIQNNFENLNKWKMNDWKLEKLQNVAIKKKAANVSVKKSVSSQAHSLAARQRIAEAKKRMLSKMATNNETFVVEVVQPLKGVFKDDSNNRMAISDAGHEKNSLLKKENLQLHGPEDSANEALQKDKLFSNVHNAKNTPKQNAKRALKNKENVLVPVKPKDKSFSRVQSEFNSENQPGGKKKKDYGTLNCVTRSAKKALLVGENTK